MPGSWPTIRPLLATCRSPFRSARIYRRKPGPPTKKAIQMSVRSKPGTPWASSDKIRLTRPTLLAPCWPTSSRSTRRTMPAYMRSENRTPRAPGSGRSGCRTATSARLVWKTPQTAPSKNGWTSSRFPQTKTKWPRSGTGSSASWINANFGCRRATTRK